ncbi:hypothetical protein pb186bvf_014325 [Paramecium bursaria]
MIVNFYKFLPSESHCLPITQRVSKVINFDLLLKQTHQSIKFLNDHN